MTALIGRSKIDVEKALLLIENYSWVLIKTENQKVIHKVNKSTGEQYITTTTKTEYIVCGNGEYVQYERLTAKTANELCKHMNIKLKDIKNIRDTQYNTIFKSTEVLNKLRLILGD